MLRTNQFSIADILALATVVAALLVGNAFATLLVCEAIAVYAFVRILTGNLPSTIRDSIDANCKRLDGSLSPLREEIEHKAQRRFFCSVLTAILFIVVPSNLLFLFVNEEAFPISVGVNAMSNFRVSPGEWKANLHDEEADFERWGKQKHLSRASIQTRKRAIWHSRPLIIVGGLAWGLFCFAFFNGTYRRAVRDLANGVELRAKEYIVHDLAKRS